MAFNKYYRKVEYSKRPDGRFNKWQEWSAVDWYGWYFSSYEADLMNTMDFSKWVLIDVVDSIDLSERN